MKIAEIIGENIRLIRIQKGIKQETLGKHIGLTKGRISQIEKGDCNDLTLSRIEKIAAYLETDFFKLVSKIPQIDSMNAIPFDGTHNNLSPDLVKAVANELVNRMNK